MGAVERLNTLCRLGRSWMICRAPRRPGLSCARDWPVAKAPGRSRQALPVAGRSGGDHETRHRSATAATCNKTETAASAGTDQS